MNMHAMTPRTAAETALMEAFGARFSELPGDEAVILRRDRAVEQLKAGLPTRRVEAWHYTDLRRLLSRVPAHDPALHASAVPALLAGGIVLPVLNGVAGKTPKIDGVRAVRVEEMLADGSIAPALGAADGDDAIGALNAAFVADGWFVGVEPGRELARPVEFHNVQAGGQAHVRFAVDVGAGARATFVERQVGTGDGLVSCVTNLVVGDGAEVVYLIVQEQPEGATHLAQFNAWIGRDAKLLVFVMNAGGRLVRQEIRVVTKGEGADFRLRGVNLLSGETHCDVTMVLHHAVPNTSSTEIVRSVVTDRARGVFQGRINVHQVAQKTDARMACNTLLLSDDAEFSAKPELEIFADDVACGHGATVTEIERSHLFYLNSRGIPEKEARGLLVKAFLVEVIEDLEDEALVAPLVAKLDAWFVEHG